MMRYFLEIDLEELINSGLEGVKGTYDDNWIKSNLYLDVLSQKTGLLKLMFARTSKNLCLVAQILERNNDKYILKEESVIYPSGLFSLELPIVANKSNLISLSFRTNYDTSVVKNGKQLYANFYCCYFEEKHIANELKINLTLVPVEITRDRLIQAKNDHKYRDEFINEDAPQLIDRYDYLIQKIQDFKTMAHELECYKVILEI